MRKKYLKIELCEGKFYREIKERKYQGRKWDIC